MLPKNQFSGLKKHWHQNLVGGVDIDVIRNFFNYFGKTLSADLAGNVVQTWSTYIPPAALRMTIVLQQAANSGLTQIVTIGRAMVLQPSFPWAKVAALFPGQITSATNALRAIGDNPYYGFNSNLDVVKSTNFRDLAYWCKEILVRVCVV